MTLIVLAKLQYIYLCLMFIIYLTVSLWFDRRPNWWRIERPQQVIDILHVSVVSILQNISYIIQAHSTNTLPLQPLYNLC